MQDYSVLKLIQKQLLTESYKIRNAILRFIFDLYKNLQ